MMRLRLWTSIFALILALSVVPALAQKAKDGSASPGDQMSRMMTMMEQMQEQMKRMHDDMAGMKGMGPMPGRMDQMMDMMQQHHAQMQKGCPGMSSPDRPKPGG